MRQAVVSRETNAGQGGSTCKSSEAGMGHPQTARGISCRGREDDGGSVMREADGYDPDDNAAKCYDVAIEAMREKLAGFRREVIGACELYLGDCREILPLLPKVDAVVTSPPYANQRVYGCHIDDWCALVGCLADTPSHEATQVLVNLGLVHRDGEVWEYWEPLKKRMRDAGWRLFGWYVWDQGSGLPGDWNGRLAPSCEFILHFNRTAREVNKTKPTLGGKVHGPGLKAANGQAGLKTHNGRPVSPTKIPDNVIRVTREVSSGFEAEHPARFPVALATEIVAPFSCIGETILDPFMGSGTTGVACVRLGRRFIGIEVEPRYYEIALKRIEAATKQGDLFISQPTPAKQLSLLEQEA
jgi:DNA modification methylase